MKNVFKLTKRINKLIYRRQFEKIYYLKAMPGTGQKTRPSLTLLSLPSVPRLNLSPVPVIFGLTIAIGIAALLIRNNPIFPEVKAHDLQLYSAPRESNYLYQNITNGFKVYLGDRHSEAKPRIKFEQDNSFAEFAYAQFPDQETKLEKDGNHSIVYKNISPEVDMKYYLTEKGIKEEIILKDKVTNPNFIFNLNLKNAVPKKSLDEHSSGFFIEPNTQEYVFHLPQPFMIDAVGNRSEAVELKIEQNSIMSNDGTQNLYTITLIPNQAWLQSAVYPVTIDPSIVHDESSEFTGTTNRIDDEGSGTSPKLRTPYHELPADIHTVGLWHINETVNDSCSGGQDACDSSGNGKHGTANGTTITTSAQKLGAAARDFNGSSDYISAPTISISNNITVEAWVNSSNYVANMFVVQKAPVNTQWELYFENPYLKWRGGSTTSVNCSLPTNGQWHHVAGVQSGTTATVYIDGAQCNTGTVTAIGNGSGAIEIGRHDGPGYYFDGLIDEVRISDTARTAEEIKQDAQRFPYGVYTSETIDLTSGNGTVANLDSLEWTDNVSTPGATLDGYPYFKPVIIDNTQNSSTLTNYQTKVKVDYDSNMQADFDDLRFTSQTQAVSAYGNEATFNNSANTEDISVTSLDTTHFVVSYREYSGNTYGRAKVGTVSGTTITYGNEYTYNSATTYYAKVAALDSTHFVVGYRDSGGDTYGHAKIGTVSGSTISYGNEYTYNSAATSEISVVVLDSTHFVVGYQDSGGDTYGHAKIGTVSGSTITYGDEYTFNSAATIYIAAATLDSSHFVVSYRDDGGDDYGCARVGTVSGTSISYGSEATFNSAITISTTVTALDSTHFVVGYRDYGGDNYAHAKVGTVSGSAIAYGGEYTFNPAVNTGGISVVALDTTHFVVSYRDYGGDTYGHAKLGTVSGSTITYGSESTFNSADTVTYPTAALDATHFVVGYQDFGGDNYGHAKVGTVVNTNLDYWIEKKSDGVEATVWVEVDTIPASSLTTIWMWYGNGGASAGSNGDNTFYFFDDFPGSSVDTNKWDVTGSPTVSGGIVTVDGDAATETIAAKSTYSYLVKIVEGRVSLANDASAVFSCQNTDPYATNDAERFIRGASEYLTSTRNEGSATEIAFSGNNAYHVYKIVQPDSSTVSFYVDGSLTQTHTTNIPDEACRIVLTSISGNYPAVLGDWVFVRQYTSPEPITGVGADIEFQTRTSSDGSTWEAWKPTTSESQIVSLDDSWWNGAWTKRKQFTVSAAAGNGVSSGYTAKFTASGTDAADIYNDSLASGNDFRILYWTGSAWSELDRDLVTFSATVIEVWFKLQAAIAGGASDNNYYAYYGNSGAGTPPANKDNVYKFYDNFESGNLNKWNEVDAGVTVIDDAGNKVAELETGSGSRIGHKLGDTSWTNYRVQARIKLVTIGAYGWRWEVEFREKDSNNRYMWGVYTANTLYLRRVLGGVYSNLAGGSYTWAAGWYDVAADAVGSSLKGYIQDLVNPLRSATDANHAYGGIRFVTWDTSSKIYVDNVLVRDLVATEPTVSAESETNNPLFTTDDSRMIKLESDSTIKMEGSGSMKSTVGSLDPDSYTRGLWHLEETSGTGAYLQDETANNNDGTPTGTTVAEGFFGKARSFNGSSYWISVGNPASLQITGQLTLEAWVNTSASSANRGIISKMGTGGIGQNVYLLRENTSGYAEFGVSSNGIDYISVSSTAVINDGKWHHLTGAYTPSAKLEIYVDGVLQNINSASIPASIYNTAGGVSIGSTYTTPSEMFSGMIDEARVSNTARTSEEIAEAYRAGRDHRLQRTISSTDLSGKTKVPFYFAADKQGTIAETYIGETDHAVYGSDSNTKGLWHLDEKPNFPESVKDSSGYGNHGLPGAIELDTFESGTDGWSYRDGNWATPAQDCTTSSVGACSVKMTDTDGGAGSNYITTKSYSSSDTMFDIKYKCESGALWGLMVYDGGTWSCIKGSGTTGCGASYNPIGSFAPAVTCDNTWRQATYDLGAGRPGYTISQTIIGDWDSQAANKWMWFDQFQIYHDSGNLGTQGKIGGARYFDGTDDYIESSLSIPNSAFTIEAWVNTTYSAASQEDIIVAKGTWQAGCIQLVHQAGTGKVYLDWYEYSGEALSTSIINDGKWHHVAGTWDGTNAKIYVDGNMGDNETPSSPASLTANTYIGARGSDGLYYQGMIDEVRVSNTVRSADEIRLAYQYGIRTHQITADYVTTAGSDGPTSTSDLQFTPDTTTNLYKGDTVIVRENYNGTNYIMQGEVSSISSGLVTVSSWSGTAPSGGYSTNADVFKWQREYWDLKDISPADRNTTVRLGLRILDASEGFTMYLDDFRNNTNYLTNNLGSTITSTANRYIQYRAILSTNNTEVTPELTSVTIDYNRAPTAPTSLLAEQQTNPSGITDLSPEFSAIYNDPDEGDVANKYRIQVDDDSGFGSTLWDSGSSGTALTNCAVGVRCEDITYGGASTDLQWGTKYYWRIKYWDVGGAEGDWSTEEAYFVMDVFKAPTGGYMDDGSQPGQITIHWQDNDNKETGFRIEREVDGGGFSLLTTEAIDATSYLDNTTSAEHTYQYRIRGNSDNGNTTWCGTTEADFSEDSFKFEGVKMEGVKID